MRETGNSGGKRKEQIEGEKNMKKYDEQLLKFQITNDKLKMEIKLSDLVWLFHNSPNNMADDGESAFCRVKSGLKQQFAEKVVEMLLDQSPHY